MLRVQAYSCITFSTHHLIQPRDQIFCAQVCIALQHLHGLVAGDGSDFPITEAGLDQSRYGFMAQIIETQTLDAGIFQRTVPGRSLVMIWYTNAKLI